MSNYWAIAVGINQYQFFQPLNYAQRDAQALRDFLVEEAQVPAQQCVLLTDSAEAVLAGAPVPNREVILAQITRVCQTLRPDDVLWVFFSGYGVRMQGRDYLVPMDGHPEKLLLTAIALDELFKVFATVPKAHIILALDMNRSQGSLHGQGVGDQAILLANSHQNCVLLLACQPDQFSQETLALRHGFFTAALLEGLRYENCLTPESLSIYLRDRLPELTEHHWRPTQAPVTVLPAEEKYVLLLPQAAALAVGVSTPVAEGVGEFRPTSVEPQLPDGGRPKAGTPRSAVVGMTGTPPATVSSGLPTPPLVNESMRSPTPDSMSLQEQFAEIWADSFWRLLILWGGGIALALMIGVVVRNREVFTFPSTPESAPANPSLQSGTPTDLETPNASPLQQAIAAMGQPTDPSLAGQTAAFANAIAIAQAIPPSDPTYADAQTSIERWQMTTLDLAQAQAAQQDYQGAIASVQALLPTDNADVEAEAQSLLVSWEVAAKNQAILAKAQSLARPDQASSLNDAIGTALTIPSGQPFYAEAQQSIAQWSQGILKLATTRAEAQDYGLAVQTAQLVPPGTVAYDGAQAAIAQWQEQAIQQQTAKPSEASDSAESSGSGASTESAE